MSDRTFTICALVFFVWMATAFYCQFTTEPDVKEALSFIDGIRKVSGK